MVALGLSVALAAAEARALSITDIEPLFFKGPSGFGFAAADVTQLGLVAAAAATPRDTWTSAGGRALTPAPALGIDQRLTQVWSNPQAAGRTPSASDPFIVDSLWTVHNDSGKPLPASFLVFLQADPLHQYPGMPIGLDGDLLSIVDYSAQGIHYLFGAVRLPSLGVGQSFDFPVRYVVGGTLDYDAGRNQLLLPRFGLSGLVVPEPAPGTALALGLIGLAIRSRGSRDGRSRRSA
jgi:hypothetical protein